MTGRWKSKQIKDNHGKNLTLHLLGSYTICLCNNHGSTGPGKEDSHGDHWMFETTVRGEGGREIALGESTTLASAKRLAAEHAKGG
jgi:hypothetical protein